MIEGSSGTSARAACNTRCTRAFFFSSRRRHTRSKRDWSSDVCSSDLREPRLEHAPDLSSRARYYGRVVSAPDAAALVATEDGGAWRGEMAPGGAGRGGMGGAEEHAREDGEIGRASCRERVWTTGGGGG